MSRPEAWIVTIGDELLRGEIVDSNKSFLSERLLPLEIESSRHLTVADEAGAIAEALREAARRAQVVLVSGGLGPTRDDITSEVAAETFGRPLVRDARAIADMRAFFARFGREMAPNNAKQADFPEGADVLRNPLGTAPGFMLEQDGALLFFMPGVPRELYRMMDEEVVPRIRAKLGGPGVVRAALLRTFGIGESNLDALLDDLVRDDPDAQLGFRTSFPDNLLRVVVRAPGEAEADARLAALVGQLRERLGDLVIGEGESSLEQTVGELLSGRGLTLATAESCSGGLLADRLTDVPGSSRYLVAGYVAYSNQAKIRDLGVPAADIEEHGAVSEPVALAMARGARERSGADIGIATTGVAGPGGGTDAKPVGTVCVALDDAQGSIAYRYTLMNERGRNKQMSAHVALDWLRRRLLGLEITSETFPRLRGEQGR
ncbi:MAG: competence/damage-inducible protein A [Proteobacteria bacterium]|nr:competence/damage-inducible protein A [Pseudomonadota bacterium]